MRTPRLGTPVPVTTEIGGATSQDRIEDATLAPVAGTRVRTMTTNDIGQLQGWPTHLSARCQLAASGHRDSPLSLQADTLTQSGAVLHTSQAQRLPLLQRLRSNDFVYQ